MSGIWVCIQNPASLFLHNSGPSILPWKVWMEWGHQGSQLLSWEHTTSHHHLIWGKNQGLQDRWGNSQVEHIMTGSCSSLQIHILYLVWRATKALQTTKSPDSSSVLQRPRSLQLIQAGPTSSSSWEDTGHKHYLVFYGDLGSALQPSWAQT
jgi:hypothetical protein